MSTINTEQELAFIEGKIWLLGEFIRGRDLDDGSIQETFPANDVFWVLDFLTPRSDGVKIDCENEDCLAEDLSALLNSPATTSEYFVVKAHYIGHYLLRLHEADFYMQSKSVDWQLISELAVVYFACLLGRVYLGLSAIPTAVLGQIVATHESMRDNGELQDITNRSFRLLADLWLHYTDILKEKVN